jgi:hypothetical protein
LRHHRFDPAAVDSADIHVRLLKTGSFRLSEYQRRRNGCL